MVSSMAIPNEIVKTIAVVILRLIPANPITPAIMTSGIILGMIEITNMRPER